MKESEATPLLCEEGNRSEESCNRAGNIGRQEEESYAETTWWKKPSVRARKIPIPLLTSYFYLGILVVASILLVCNGSWRCARIKTEFNPLSIM